MPLPLRRCFPLRFLLALTLLASPAAADVLLLKGGGKVEGVVADRGDRYEVKSLTGRVEIPKEQVADRVRSPYITEVYEQRRARIDDSSAQAHFELHSWCERSGLAARAREHLQRTLELDPDHAGARALRGEVRYAEGWLPAEEAHAARMSAAGFVRFQGHWFTPEGLEVWLRAREEQAKLAREEELRAEDRAAAERAKRIEEEQLKLLVAERQALERALRDAEAGREERERLARENGELKDLVRDLLRERDRSSVYDTWYQPFWPMWVAAPTWFGGSPGWCPPARRQGGGLDFRYRRGHLDVRGRVR